MVIMSSLICLCASHITGAKRLSNFRKMLKSIVSQKVQVPLFVSVSTSNDYLQQEVKSIAEEHPHFTFFIQDNKLTQFEHYAFLANAALSYDPQQTWCIFTDDDDVSHPSRTKVFLEHISSITDDTEVVVDTAVYTKYANVFNQEDDDDVDDVIVSEFFKPITTEYVIHACKLCVLQEFCNKASAPILAMAACDIVFTTWLSQGKTKNFHNKTWLYEYTIRPGTSRSIAFKENLLNVDFGCLQR